MIIGKICLNRPDKYAVVKAVIKTILCQKSVETYGYQRMYGALSHAPNNGHKLMH